MRHITITLLGYGEIKGETFPDDDFVDQGYGYTGQYNNNPQQSKPELPPHYSQFN